MPIGSSISEAITATDVSEANLRVDRRKFKEAKKKQTSQYSHYLARDASLGLIKNTTDSQLIDSPSDQLVLQKQDIIQLNEMAPHHRHHTPYNIHAQKPRSRFNLPTSNIQASRIRGSTYQAQQQQLPTQSQLGIPASNVVLLQTVPQLQAIKVAHQEPTRNTEATTPDINLSTPIYSPKHLSLALKWSAYTGSLSSLTLWLLFIYAAILLDFLDYEVYLLVASTYEIVSSLDAGLVSSLINHLMGWPTLSILLIMFTLLFSYGLMSRSSMVVIITGAILVLLDTLVIVEALGRAVPRFQDPGRGNIVVIILVCIVFYFGHITIFILLTRIVGKLSYSQEFPQEKTLSSQR